MLTLSPVPYLPAPTESTCENELQVSVVRSLDTIPELLSANAATHVSDFGEEQRKDPNLKLLIFPIWWMVTQSDDEMRYPGSDFLSDVHFSDFVTLRSRRTARAQ